MGKLLNQLRVTYKHLERGEVDKLREPSAMAYMAKLIREGDHPKNKNDRSAHVRGLIDLCTQLVELRRGNANVNTVDNYLEAIAKTLESLRIIEQRKAE